MLVFIAMPYSQLCDENYILKDKYKNFCLTLTKKLKDMGCDYFLAHERENWGKEYSDAAESTQIDFNTINKCDLVCMIPGSPISGGVHVELGWASSAKKNINMFLKKGDNYSPMVTGIHALTNVKYYEYNDDLDDALIDCIIKSVEERMNN